MTSVLVGFNFINDKIFNQFHLIRGSISQIFVRGKPKFQNISFKSFTIIILIRYVTLEGF